MGGNDALHIHRGHGLITGNVAHSSVCQVGGSAVVQLRSQDGLQRPARLQPVGLSAQLHLMQCTITFSTAQLVAVACLKTEFKRAIGHILFEGNLLVFRRVPDLQC